MTATIFGSSAWSEGETAVEDQALPAEDFGGALRRVRESEGISLREIADETKISVSVLEALERNDVSRLPGSVFSRGFVRSYAQQVGLDPERAVQEFIERFQPDDTAHGTAHTAESDLAQDLESRRQIVGVALQLAGISLLLAAAVLFFL